MVVTCGSFWFTPWFWIWEMMGGAVVVLMVFSFGFGFGEMKGANGSKYLF